MKAVVGVIILLGFAAFGFVLASDFHGFARKRAERSLATARPTGILVRRNWAPEDAPRRLARAIRIYRFVGLVFLFGSLAALVGAIASA